MTARSGMADIISQVRQLSATGTADYTVGTATYWSDDALQTILDRVRVEIWHEPIPYVEQYTSSGSVTYTEYRIPWTWLEQTSGGTSIFYLQDATYAVLGTANYTADYQYGRVSFAANQHGSVRYLTGRSYDVYEAAARVWEQKAGHVAMKYDFTADGASFKASQERTSYLEMARQMRSQSSNGGLRSARMVRDDVNNQDEVGAAVKGFHIVY
jgi:hypothetical protein